MEKLHLVRDILTFPLLLTMPTDLILLAILVPRLCPVFDYKFKPNLSKFTGLSWSHRVARTAFYARKVVFPNRKEHFIRNANGYDFRSRVNKCTYRLCVLHVVLFGYFLAFNVAFLIYKVGEAVVGSVFRIFH